MAPRPTIKAMNALTGEQPIEAGGSSQVGERVDWTHRQARALLNWSGILTYKAQQRLGLQRECRVVFIAASTAVLSEEHWVALGEPLELTYVAVP